MKPVYTAQHLRDRKLQRALLQFFKPENYFEVRQALEQAGRQDLIGNGCDALIPAQPPREALDQRRKRANDQIREQRQGDHIRGKPKGERGGPAANGGGNAGGNVGNAGGESGAPKKQIGYRPHRKTQSRRDRRK
jgi:hypothetical protein